MARCASMISPTDTPARSSCTASASANRRALPCATRAPPPEPTLISTTPWASNPRRAPPSRSLLQARGLGNTTPALALRLDVSAEFFGTAAERVDALRPPGHHHVV